MFKDMFVPRSKHTKFRLLKTQLMFYKGRIAGCSEVHIKHTNILFDQNVEFLNVIQEGIYTGEENKLQRQKILSFIYPIYNHNWKNISNIYIYIYIKTSIK